MNNFDYKKFISPQCRSLSFFGKRKLAIKGRSISFTPLNNLNIFNIQGSIFQKDSLRRKSCHCTECGNVSKFQYKYMNLTSAPHQKRKTEYQSSIESRRQTKNSTFFKYRTIILNQVKKNKTDQQQLESIEATPKECTDLKESLHKLREYFNKQEEQKKQITTNVRSLRYIGNKTPVGSPHGYKSPSQREFIPYLSYRRIELVHLKPLKFTDTLKSFQIHKKTLSTQY